MDKPQSNIVSFISHNKENQSQETLYSFNYEFKIKVSELDYYRFESIENIPKVKFSINYQGRPSESKTVSSFKSSFKNDEDYKKIHEEVDILISIEKSLFNINSKFKNFYIFSSYEYFEEKFGKPFKSFKWDEDESKLYIFYLFANKIINYENDFLMLSNYNNFNAIDNNYIPSLALEKYKTLKKIDENSVVTDLFNYPLSWISKESNSPEVFLNHAFSLFFEIISSNSNRSDILLIKGYKNIYYEKEYGVFHFYNTDDINEYTYKLIDFLIDQDKFNDKILILRSSISLYLDTTTSIEDYIDKAKEIFKTVEHNFELYIQDEIKVFLEQKNALLHEYIGVSRQLGELTNDLSKQVRTIGLSLLGSVFIGIVSNLNGEFSIETVNFVLLSYTIFYIINFAITFSHYKQFSDTKELLKEYTSTVASNNKELSFIKLENEYLSGPTKNFKSVIFSTWSLLIILILIFMGTYLSINFEVFPWITDLIKFVLNSE